MKQRVLCLERMSSMPHLMYAFFETMYSGVSFDQWLGYIYIYVCVCACVFLLSLSLPNDASSFCSHRSS